MKKIKSMANLKKMELTNARVKKYRKKNSSMQDDPTEEMQNKQVNENNAERKKAIAKEHSKRFHEKKRLNVLKRVHHVIS